MNFNWLNKKDNKKLIVFFNGWGMNKSAIEHLEFCDFDVLEINDYRSFELNFSQFDFKKYSEKYLICWSMGVYIANLFYDFFKNFDKKIAINGTPKMIDDNFGIPKRIYQITIRLFNEESCNKFIKNMFKNENINPQIKIEKTTAELKDELISIQNIILKKELDFDMAIISDNDKIVPTKNQFNYWENKTIIKKINATHYPFENYKNWSDLLC